MKGIAWGALILSMVALTGCKTPAELNAISAKARTLMTAPDYIMEEGDEIAIRVLGFDEYKVEKLVRPDGKIAFPQHGDIIVAGKTAPQLRKELERAFKGSLKLAQAPTVYVAVNSFASKGVTIMGQVQRPGRFPYEGQMRVIDLLGLAVGVDEVTSSPNRTVLFREVDGATKVYQVRLKDFYRKGDYSTNFFLRPGDIVYVPRNGFAWVAQKIRIGMLPIEAVFDAVGLGASTTNYFAP